MSLLGQLTAFDIAVVVVILLSALLALARGLLLEVVSLLSWVGAAVVAWLAFPELRPLAAQAIGQPLATDVVTALVCFLVPLIVFRVIGGMLADAVQGAGLGIFDRLLGLVFGAARGAALVCVGYLLAGMVLGRETFPSWVTVARLEPQVRAGADLIEGWLPAAARAQAHQTVEGALGRAQRGRVEGDPAAGPKDSGSGYAREPREQMNRLFDQAPSR